MSLPPVLRCVELTFVGLVYAFIKLADTATTCLICWYADSREKIWQYTYIAKQRPATSVHRSYRIPESKIVHHLLSTSSQSCLSVDCSIRTWLHKKNVSTPLLRRVLYSTRLPTVRLLMVPFPRKLITHGLRRTNSGYRPEKGDCIRSVQNYVRCIRAPSNKQTKMNKDKIIIRNGPVSSEIYFYICTICLSSHSHLLWIGYRRIENQYSYRRGFFFATRVRHKSAIGYISIMPYNSRHLLLYWNVTPYW